MKKIKFNPTIFILACSIAVVLAIGFPTSLSNSGQPQDTPAIEQTVVSSWNGFNNHQVITECINLGSVPTSYLLEVFDQKNNALGQEIVNIDANATVHSILNKFGITDNYGLVKISSTNGQAPALKCSVMTYRMDAQNSVEYATTMLFGDSVVGTSYGVVNSMNPSTGAVEPVYNWLSIYNPGTDLFSSTVELRDASGKLIEEKVISLGAGERSDLAMLHPSGQSVGQYRIVPANETQNYGAFLSRYSKQAESFNFSMVFPATSGLNNSGIVSASTMGPAINWAEIVNPNPFNAKAKIEVFSRNSELLFEKEEIILAYAQKHLYLNEIIGEDNVGYFRVKTTDGSSLLVQSLVYGFEPNHREKITWAYNIGAKGTQYSREIHAPINTYLNSPNWLKVFNPTSEPVPLELELFNGKGESIATKKKSYLLQGSLDISLLEEVGQDFVGSLVLRGTNEFAAELIRVFNNQTNPGKLAYVMPVTIVASGGKGSDIDTLVSSRKRRDDDEDSTPTPYPTIVIPSPTPTPTPTPPTGPEKCISVGGSSAGEQCCYCAYDSRINPNCPNSKDENTCQRFGHVGCKWQSIYNEVTKEWKMGCSSIYRDRCAAYINNKQCTHVKIQPVNTGRMEAVYNLIFWLREDANPYRANAGFPKEARCGHTHFAWSGHNSPEDAEILGKIGTEFASQTNACQNTMIADGCETFGPLCGTTVGEKVMRHFKDRIDRFDEGTLSGFPKGAGISFIGNQLPVDKTLLSSNAFVGGRDAGAPCSYIANESNSGSPNIFYPLPHSCTIGESCHPDGRNIPVNCSSGGIAGGGRTTETCCCQNGSWWLGAQDVIVSCSFVAGSSCPSGSTSRRDR